MAWAVTRNNCRRIGDFWPDATNFVQLYEPIYVYFGVSFITDDWYEACSIDLGKIAMKPLNNYSSPDQNWQWPEKTWFRERLNAIKAREHEQRRKPVVGNQTTQGASEPANPEKGPLKAD